MSLPLARHDLLEVNLGPCARGYFTTRGTGASRVPGEEDTEPGYRGLNLATHVGDDPARVMRNRAALEDLLGLGRGGIAWMEQVHSAVVARAVRGRAPTADALVLDVRTPGVGPLGNAVERPEAVGVLVADCVPVLLATSEGSLVAAVHAGRKGVVAGVVTRAVEVMAEAGADPADLHVAVGPSVCGACYEVPEQMRAACAVVEPACAATTRWGTPGLDLAAGVVAQLERAGAVSVVRTGCSWGGTLNGPGTEGPWCTYEDERFFSYRRRAVTGRLAGVVVPHTAG